MKKRLQPDYLANAVEDIDLDGWWAEGVRGLILDVDDTLTRHNSPVMSAEVRAWLAEAQQKGFLCYLVSNNAFPEHIEAVSQRVGIPAIARARKPRRAGFDWALEQSGLAPDQVVAIGDRILTDVWGGRRAGMKTCLVKPVSKVLSRRKRWLYALEKNLSHWVP